MKKYQVIGGQYESCWYGESDTLRGARRIANAHEEYWDNFGGWHTPAIYAAEDVEEYESRGRITTPDGWDIRGARMGAQPIPDGLKDIDVERWGGNIKLALEEYTIDHGIWC